VIVFISWIGADGKPGEMVRVCPMTKAGLRSLFRHHRATTTIEKANPHRAHRAFQGRANQNNVEPMGNANPTQLVVERNVRYILVRPNPGESPDITAKFHRTGPLAACGQVLAART
jgi:hypothetical protein